MAEAPEASGSKFTSRFAGLRGHHHHDEDPFANFSYNPPRPAGRFRSFSRRNRYQSSNTATMASLHASREKLCGSNTNLSGFGSTQDLTMDSGRLMNMAEDARSRKISAEVMKHRLYESVITSPRRRRFSMRADYYGSTANDEPEIQGFRNVARYVQSLPVTPAHSENVTPVHSPTANKKFFGFFSRGTTPDEEQRCLPETAEEDNWKGLASLFKPQPRCIPAHQSENEENEGAENRLRPPLERPGVFHRYQNDDDGAVGGLILQEVRRTKRRTRSPQHQPMDVTENNYDAVAPPSF